MTTQKTQNHKSKLAYATGLAAVLAASAPFGLQAEKLSKSAPAYVPAGQVNSWLDGRAEINFLALQNYQAIQAKAGAFRPEDEVQSDGFGRLRLNLQLKFHINEHITADVDIAEEPNDFGNNGDRDFAFHQDFAGIEFDLFGLTNSEQDDADLTLRIGNIGAAPFQFKGFQDGADNQGNALIGNGMIDYATAENGVQLSYSKTLDDGGPITGYNLAGHVTTSSFGEAFQDNRGYNYRLQGTLEFAGGFKAGLNMFQANQGDQLTFAGGLASLAGVTTTNYRFGDGDNYNFSASGSSERDTHIGALPGLDQSILQLNLAYQPTPNTSLIFMIGESSDDYTFADTAGNAVPGITYFGTDGVVDPNGTTHDAMYVVRGNSSVEYYILEAQQYLVPEKFYVAARYAEAENTSDLISQSNNTAERLQVAAGYWINDRTLLKFEYVDQDEGANSGGQIGKGFDGFTSELSVKF
ncbi:hypothetical protein [Pelagicoccus sp. SDUM812005]|uniref:hypothetical protein n=1 Tax=Pelagicoccus sp. SDUM812005 TaxID=3041257 RepID=UPI00280F8E14|nr:hypothetical protein [Pelagicoccus sp. SDUM812005]MDQ8182936.1 hypothetical protein [Pelagicoccus sp. SDUM812005]